MLRFLIAFLFVLPVIVTICGQNAYASFVTEVTNDGAVSHWNFEEMSGSVLDSIGSSTGTVLGTPDTQQDALVGKGYNFSPNEGVDLSDDIFNGHLEGAIEAIIKIDSTSGHYGIFGQGDADSANNQLFLSINNGRPFLHTRTDGTAISITGDTVLNTLDYYHIVGEVSSTTGMHLYVNGVEDTPYVSGGGPSSTIDWFATTTASVATAKYAIGYLNRSIPTLYFDGVIDELAIYDASKSEEVWLNHYDSITGTTSDSITLTAPSHYQTYQRNDENEADINITGTYTGTPTAIEARFNDGSWTTIESSPSGNSFSGTLSNQQASQGAVEVRFTNATTTADSATYVGIGDIFAIAGQSNASGRGTNNQTYSHESLKATRFTGSWNELTDPVDGEGGSVWPLLATHYIDNQSVPVAFITDPPEGGTSIVSWQKGEALYTTLSNRISDVGDIKAVLYWQGEKDVGIDMASTTYNSYLDTLANDIYSDFGVKTVVAQIGEYLGKPASSKNEIRLAQKEAWEDNENVIPGPSLYDVNLTVDGLHFKTDGELQTAADRWWAAIEAEFYEGDDGKGPQFVEAVENSDRTAVIITFSDETLPLLPATSIEGFRVTDDGATTTISSITRTASTTLTITLDSALTGSTTTVSLGYGDEANGLAVPTDSSAYNLPAEIFINEIVSAYTPSDPSEGDSEQESIQNVRGNGIKIELGKQAGQNTDISSITKRIEELEKLRTTNPIEYRKELMGIVIDLMTLYLQKLNSGS